MLSSAVVIFREIFEIALILSIVLAATRGFAGRIKWLSLGVLGGVLGAGLVALFIDVISNFADGIGQELFSAIILFTASGFIGWTVLWMAKHAREMSAHLKSVCASASKGELPFYSLVAVIALAILREGAEIVLFTYGMIAAGQDAGSIIAGSALGIISGVTVGALLYYGLINISQKHFFRVTSWLLILLVAGMASQGARYLAAADIFDVGVTPLWNTSHIIADGGVVGQTFQMLLGYSAQPIGVQVAFYLGTLALMLSLLKFQRAGAPAMAKAGAVASILAIGLFTVLL